MRPLLLLLLLLLLSPSVFVRVYAASPGAWSRNKPIASAAILGIHLYPATDV
jgi:predicted alpha/beta superfamily hydrolase